MIQMRSVHSRMAVVATVACVGILCVAALGVDMGARLYHQEANQRLHRELASWLVRHYGFERDGKVDREGAEPLFADAMRVNPTIEIYLTDASGRILAFNAPKGQVKLASVSLGPIRALLSGTSTLPIFGTDPRNPSVPQIFSVLRSPRPRESRVTSTSLSGASSIGDFLRGCAVVTSCDG